MLPARLMNISECIFDAHISISSRDNQIPYISVEETPHSSECHCRARDNVSLGRISYEILKYASGEKLCSSLGIINSVVLYDDS